MNGNLTPGPFPEGKGKRNHNLMWSSDYPHTDTTWPDSKKYIEESLAGVPADERYKILAGNAVKLYALS